jgi:putative CocE/NonD family hydrolase
MRDGIELSANVFLPSSGGPFPTILLRTPYRKGTAISPNLRAFVENGYAVVFQDVRGRGDSEGVFEPLTQEIADGEDTLAWIARQEWSNRRVGMIGGSYLGIAQWKAALSRSPYLKAIFPVVAGADEYFDRFYSPGGALKLGHRLEWLAENCRAPDVARPDFRRFVLNLPVRTSDRAATGRPIDFFQQALDHPAYDSYWRSLSTLARLDNVRVPVFAVAGWYDNFAESDLAAFERGRERGRVHRLMVGPWPHDFSYRFPGVDLGPEARVPLRPLQLAWYDYWLKRHGEAPAAQPPLRIFILGANRWRDEQEWPLRRARLTPLYLASKGHANTLSGDGRLEWRGRSGGADRFTYDPRNPAPTLGGAVCCNPKLLPWGPKDQRPVEKRADVLVYTSAPLSEPVEVTGPIRAVLHVATSAPDTDFTVKLVDVFPDGQARNLSDGILRLRYRDSIEKPVAAIPGQVYPVTVNAGVTANEFAKGHRIRVEISSSNFPRFDRNPNTGRRISDERELRPAQQTVYHDRQRPSYLLLPVVPPETPVFSRRVRPAMPRHAMR